MRDVWVLKLEEIMEGKSLICICVYSFRESGECAEGTVDADETAEMWSVQCSRKANYNRIIRDIFLYLNLVLFRK